MKIQILCVFAVTILINPGFGQYKWEKVFGGAGMDQAFSVQQTQEGGYIVAGFTGSFGYGCFDAWVIKTNAYGDSIWSNTYGTPNNDYCWSIIPTSDGGYALLGATDSIFQTGPHDFYFVKIDAVGETLWSAVYGDTDKIGQTDDVGHEVQQTQDGGYILVGSTQSFGAGYYDIYLVKIDSVGDTLWTRTYGTASNEYGATVQQTDEGAYIIAGCAEVPGSADDAYLIRTDTQGNILWSKTYGGVSNENAVGVCQTPDRGFIFVGSTSSYGAGNGDVYLVKTDSLGNIIWTQVYGGAFPDWGNAVRLTQDGGYIVVGGKRTAVDPEYCYVWLLKTDSNGDTVWTKIKQSATANGMDVQQTQDGGYIIAAITWEYGGSDDFYLIKTDSSGVSAVEEQMDRILAESQSLLRAYPNPFVCFTTISNYDEELFIVYDILGKQVGTYKGNKVGTNLPAGVYFITQENKNCPTIRIVKIR